MHWFHQEPRTAVIFITTLVAALKRKDSFVTDRYVNYFSVTPLLFKHQGSELAQVEYTCILSVIY